MPMRQDPAGARDTGTSPRSSGRRPRRRGWRTFPVLALLAVVGHGRSADVVPPIEPQSLLLQVVDHDVVLSWPAVSSDITGVAETVQEYRVYRASSADFVPGESNRIGQPVSNSFDHVGAAAAGDPSDSYYLVSAVDSNAVEGNRRAARVGSPAIVSASYTDESGAIAWTPAAGVVAGYRVFWGASPLAYSSSFDVGSGVTTADFGPFVTGTTYYATVLAIDVEGNLSEFVGEASIPACPGASATLKPNSHVPLEDSDGGFSNYPGGGSPTNAWDHDPDSRADCVYNGLWWAVCGGAFGFPDAGTTSGHLELTISMVPHCAPGPPAAEASYSTDGGQSWTLFVSAQFPFEDEPSTFSSGSLDRVDTGQLLVEVRGKTAFGCDEGQAFVHDISFIGCAATLPSRNAHELSPGLVPSDPAGPGR